MNKTYIWLALLSLSLLILVPELQASFATPFVTKGQEFVSGVIKIGLVLAAICFAGALIGGLSGNIDWRKCVTIVGVAVALGAFSLISGFFVDNTFGIKFQ